VNKLRMRKIFAFKTLQTRDRQPVQGWALLLAAVVSLTVLAMATLAQKRDSPPAQADSQANQTKTKQENAAEGYFGEIELVNQNGEKMRLYSDLLKGKVVIINSFFATCQGSCLPLNRNLEKVQAAMGDHIGKDLYIISISVDPTVDTPARPKEYAKKLNAQPGWYFLTGEKEKVDLALYKLGQYVENKQDHLNIFIIGNERTGLWKKAFGLARSDELVKVVESVLNDKPEEK
jgi:protein SCO1/2